jgi:hypothetical protein
MRESTADGVNRGWDECVVQVVGRGKRFRKERQVNFFINQDVIS